MRDRKRSQNVPGNASPLAAPASAGKLLARQAEATTSESSPKFDIETIRTPSRTDVSISATDIALVEVALWVPLTLGQ